jgi:putative membrane protein
MLANILIGLVALEHVYILVLEMFLWTTPRTRKTFGLTAELAHSTRAMAANQGLYNGFLAAGLVWSLIHPDAGTGRQIGLFFLGCVLAAALYGGATAKRSIWLMQGLPALIALAALLWL